MGAKPRLLGQVRERLRVKDLEPADHQVLVRDGKGSKDRETILLESLVDPLQRHLQNVRTQHGQALRRHHPYSETVQRQAKSAVRAAGLALLGQGGVQTTRICAHVMRKGADAVQSPLGQ
jgi:hypothetical protein